MNAQDPGGLQFLHMKQNQKERNLKIKENPV